MVDLHAVQASLVEFGLDGWLLYDFRGSNLLARRLLSLSEQDTGSRRLYYCIPAQGQPRKLVHRIESGALDSLPGAKHVYLTWQELEQGIGELLRGLARVAMEYSPRCAIPYVSKVDAGTLELVRSRGVEVVSSGDLIQRFEATWDDEQWEMHLEATQHTRAAFDRAFEFIARQIRAAGSVRETQVQQVILDHFAKNKLLTNHPPIVAVNEHSGDPHYAPRAGSDGQIREGDFVLIDLWAKLDRPRSVYSDLTRVAFVGKSVPEKYERVFQIVAAARDAAIDCVRTALASHAALQGWQVDQAARDVITAAGYGPQFVHRTGHSIGQETHGNGANMDNLENREERCVMRRTCFSVEPGIYLDEFGVRSEINVFVDADGQVQVTGDPQAEVLPLLRAF
jgi:Xaa-Pro aminopeptidase